jgi:hypothetical protein
MSKEFRNLMQCSRGCSKPYFYGYQAGLNKRLRGNNSTNFTGARLLGFLDGLHGTKPRSYCIQNGNNCYTCPLCSYGFDCKDNAVLFVNKEGSIRNAGTY